ncbi:TonB-dependent receptor plug domain-containing protein [Thalassotalea fusca]
MTSSFSSLNWRSGALLFCGCMQVAGTCVAAPSNDDLFNLSLEALSNIKVTSSSVVEKTLSRAPNIVSVVTAEQIEMMGANTLSDILMYLPGVQILHRRNGRDMLWIRGIPSGRNTKTLLLIDGVPQNEAVFGGWSPDEAVRVDNIARIELIRGPGSALYGGNAYAGVVAVVTKDATATSHVSAHLGKFQTSGASFAYSVQRDDINYRFSGRAYDTQGYAQDYDRSGVVSDHHNDVDALSGQIKIGAGSWLVDYRYDNYMTEYPMYASGDYKSQRYKSHNISLQLNHEFSNFLLKNIVYYSTTDRVFDRDAVRGEPAELFFASDSQLDSSRMGLKSYATINHSDTLQTSLGLFFDKWQVSEYHETIFVENFLPTERLLSGLRDGENDVPSAENYAVLWQQDIALMDRQLEMIVGARYDHHAIFGDKVSSRLGMTWQSSEDWSAKLLWGSAYRPPTFLQQYEIRSDNNVPGNPNIKPETIKTTEFELSYYVSAAHTISARLFNSDLRDFIQSIDGGQYQNTDDRQSIFGTEIEWRQVMTFSDGFFDNASLDMNYTHLNTDEASVARDIVNATLSLENDHYAVFLALNAVGRRNESDTYHNRVRNEALVDADNKRSVIEGSVNVKIKQFLAPNLSLGLKVSNFGNARRFNPTYAPDGYYDVKGRPLYYEAKLQYTF